MKTIGILALAGVLVLTFSGWMYAGGIVPTGLDSPEKVVKARKAMMKAIKLNAKDIAQKAESGNVSAITANALAISVMAQVMPPLYEKKHDSAYDGKGKYYKGATPAEFEAASSALYKAAQTVANASKTGDAAGVASGMVQVQQSCGACHKAYRGKF